nr:immunoglobulin light chain junction region [Mus musculus]NSL98306.1 immunoglobulin light chain junction region [Mus musculus]NSL98556.1 immunoglobulin light chain junction region [Mus musculus]NSL99020.1 immunoglobulin light chain junction region [Mus musculus]NSL99822.1 immunoglobulin light chain junction region [Mus musculus]
CQQHLHIPFTF